MGITLKDKNGNVLIRPVSHAMTDAQAKIAVENAIADGTVTSYLGIPNTDPKILASSFGLNIVQGEYCDPATGIIADDSRFTSFVRSEYIQVSPGNLLRVTYGQSYVFFDESKTYISGGNVSDLPGYTGNLQENFMTIPSGVSFVLFNFYYEYNLFAVLRESNTDPEIVVLGDSIYGLNPHPFNAVYYASEALRRNIADCAFGGTTASQHYNSDYDNYSFHHIADCIASGDFSSMADFNDMPAIYKQHRSILANADWSKVKVICVAYGTNDWNFSNLLDNEQNAKDKTSYMGALRYGIEKIWTEYPGIQFVLFGATYRKVTNDGNKDSDTAVNTRGKKLADFITGMESVANEYHQNFFDHYNIGFNSINAGLMFRDGTHPSYGIGSAILGKRSAKEIESVLWW